MSKTVTLRLSDKTYQRFLTLAERENRSLADFIKTAALRYINAEQFVDGFEMDKIHDNTELNGSLKRGAEDAEAGRGRFT